MSCGCIVVFYYRGYEAELKWSGGDGVYWGRVLESGDGAIVMPDNHVLLFEGKTMEEAEADFRGTVDDYIDGGIPPGAAYDGG